MAVSEALWGGFSSFFSIWQVCILQISPFFIAYIVGIYLIDWRQVGDSGIRQQVVLPYFAFVVGFTVFYSLLIASGLGISRTVLYHISDLRLLSGIVIFLVGLYLLLLDHVAILGRICKLSLVCIVSLTLGATFAIIYSPCITPTLSVIMSMASQPQTVSNGWALAFTYGLGLSLSLGLAGIVFILLLRKSVFVQGHVRLIKDICATVVLVLGVLNITGFMTHYKAFFLGLLV